MIPWALAGLAFLSAPAETPFQAELAAWRKARNAALAAEDGWLTLVGLHWLRPGENAVGSDPEGSVRLEGPGIPPRALVLRLEGGAVRATAEPGAGVTVNGEGLSDRLLATDEAGRPDRLGIGGLRAHVIRRGDRFALRVKDPASPARARFRGVPCFPPDPALRVEATFTAYDPPREIPVATVLGTRVPMRVPGRATFRLKGRELVLEPVLEAPDSSELFFMFKDATNGRGTYGAGRFLYTPLPKDGRVVLDFNRAENPPCAFTPFATCPLAPRQNWLPVALRAGEKDPGH